MMKMRYLPAIGRKDDSFMRFFNSLMPRFDAASISTTSGKDDLSMLRQFTQLLQGSMEVPTLLNTLERQLTDFANIRAVDVLPVPFCPPNKKACGRDLLASIFFITSRGVMLSISSIDLGR